MEAEVVKVEFLNKASTTLTGLSSAMKSSALGQQRDLVLLALDESS